MEQTLSKNFRKHTQTDEVRVDNVTNFIQFKNGVSVAVPKIDAGCTVHLNHINNSLLVRCDGVLHNSLDAAIIRVNGAKKVSKLYFLNSKQYSFEEWLEARKTNISVCLTKPQKLENKILAKLNELQESKTLAFLKSRLSSSHKTTRVKIEAHGNKHYAVGQLKNLYFAIEVSPDYIIEYCPSKEMVLVQNNGLANNIHGPDKITFNQEGTAVLPVYAINGYSLSIKDWKNLTGCKDSGLITAFSHAEILDILNSRHNPQASKQPETIIAQDGISPTAKKENVKENAGAVARRKKEFVVVMNKYSANITDKPPTCMLIGKENIPIEYSELSDADIVKKAQNEFSKAHYDVLRSAGKCYNGFFFSQYGWYAQIPKIDFTTHKIVGNMLGFEVINRETSLTENPLGFAKFKFGEPSYIEYVGHPTLSGTHNV